MEREDVLKSLATWEADYKMKVKTLEDVILRGSEKAEKEIRAMMHETYLKMAELDDNFARRVVQEGEKELSNENNETSIMPTEDESITARLNALGEEDNVEEVSDNLSSIFDNIEEDTDIYDLANQMEGDEEDDTANNLLEAEKKVDGEESMYNNIDPNAEYDLIPLPSKGECYKNKIDRLPVGFLTASDENILTSPNLIDSGNIQSVLLKKKVLNKDINVDDLTAGDVDAIMLFLRATSYGFDFPIETVDPETKQVIKTTIDLRTLKYKPFTLKGDANGYFTYEMPTTKALVKFKFLTKRDQKLLQKLNEKEYENIIGYDLDDAIKKIKQALKNDKTLSSGDKGAIIEANKKIEKWAQSANAKNKTNPYTKTITNLMEMQIVEVNGERDRNYIHNFIMKLNAKDALSFRRYIFANQPGVDFEVEVERPESMGGGSFKVFLEWGDDVFWSII